MYVCICMCVYVCVYVCVCMCMCVCVYVLRIFFFHPFVDGHLGCFHVSAIVNSAVMNIGVHIRLQITNYSLSAFMFSNGIVD